MKKITTLLLFCVASTGMLFSQAGPEILHYRFNGNGTSVPNEASAPPAGTENAVIMGGLTQGAGGQCGGALIGSGNASSTDYLNTNYAPNVTGSWTISMYTKDITASTVLFYIFGDANTNSFRCFTNGVAGPDNWILRGPFSADVYINGGATVAPHVTTFVYDAVAGNVYGYLDGVLVTTVAENPVLLIGAGPLKVMGYATNVGAPAGGKLDEFRMYSRALSAAEVAELTYSPYHISAAVTACDSYTSPGGSVAWTTSGAYTDTLTSTSGCDSIVDYTLTIKNSSTSTITETVCDSFTAPDGVVYTTSGLKTSVIPNVSGCDSTITINLTIKNSTTAMIAPTACDTYTAADGSVHTISGTFSVVIPNAAGCDSTITVNLTINNATTGTMTEVACGSYTAPDATTYTSSGMYSVVIPNIAGCDSVISLDLTVNQPSASTMSVTGCGSYTAPDGAVYTTSGMETAIIPNAGGCDSTISISLTIVNLDATVTDNTPTLTANATAVAYQWVNCVGDTLIGETGQSYMVTANGDYAVIVSGSGCVDTSDCINVIALGIAEAATGSTSIFPNPASAGFTVQTATIASLIVVYDVLGKTIAEVQPAGNTTVIGMEGQKDGVYFVKISSAAGTETRRLIKQ